MGKAARHRDIGKRPVRGCRVIPTSDRDDAKAAGTHDPVASAICGARFMEYLTKTEPVLLLRFDCSILDHLRPFDELDPDELVELRRRARKAFEAHSCKARLHFRAVDDLAQFGIEPCDDLPWRVGGRE